MEKETTTKAPTTFMQAIRTLVATDIAQGNFEILELEENGKYGHGKFAFTGTEVIDVIEPRKGLPYDYTLEFTLKPGEDYADVILVDNVAKETLITQDRLYREDY